ncbi:hypothetical protein SARC_03984 [Sphaeroforma arctica JP610]|uniref:Uncharacterized protein n=1 Tax=Sphaeroforma arctica JP610 TaxID=667725 RepID=A0A0L0G6F3_9EUKA|nr:hypothetical protein SARC_03984 [Sphaeroforma arctica JP610]KNC83808.1 hypothetical protein SARC_03984 [Sphaeroforma arctica JP610]|eukprot:XP_014157710.1 hypothetical protein SARC_03984 [Sphaeroforma arctica JP610]
MALRIQFGTNASGTYLFFEMVNLFIIQPFLTISTTKRKHKRLPRADPFTNPEYPRLSEVEEIATWLQDSWYAGLASADPTIIVLFDNNDDDIDEEDDIEIDDIDGILGELIGDNNTSNSGSTNDNGIDNDNDNIDDIDGILGELIGDNNTSNSESINDNGIDNDNDNVIFFLSISTGVASTGVTGVQSTPTNSAYLGNTMEHSGPTSDNTPNSSCLCCKQCCKVDLTQYPNASKERGGNHWKMG